MNKEKQQEILFKLAVFEQQTRQLQEQLQAVEEGIIEISSLNLGLDDLVKGKGKEIFAPIGRGIFSRAKISSEKLLVDVGGKNFVEKTIPETKKLIEKQIQKLESIKKELDSSINKIEKEISEVIEKAQK